MNARRLLAHFTLHGVAYFSFVVLGLPDGMLGVAWPSVSETFGRPLGSLGVLLFGFTAGYLLTTTVAGPLLRRLGYAGHLLRAAVLMALGGVGMAVAPSWPLMIGAAAFLGAGAGMLDGGLNAYGALQFRSRDLNWLHAAYGIGATGGPLIMTPIVASSMSWRFGYGLFAGTALLMVVAFRLSRNAFRVPVGTGKPGGEASEGRKRREPTGQSADRSAGGTGRRWVVFGGSVVVFFLYTGVEVVAGQWSYSLFTIGRGVEASQAGPWVSGYWAALTAGRVVFGWIAERFTAAFLLRVTSLTAIGGVLLLWLGRPPFLGAVALAVLGFSLAPMFPLLIGETPRRVGVRRSDHAVGLQIAASNIGAVSLVGLAGTLVESMGLEVIGAALLVNVLLFAAVNEVMTRVTAPSGPR
ncbi:MAG: MFS transporter [Spirochaetaceae bacterium]